MTQHGSLLFALVRPSVAFFICADFNDFLYRLAKHESFASDLERGICRLRSLHPAAPLVQITPFNAVERGVPRGLRSSLRSLK